MLHLILLTLSAVALILGQASLPAMPVNPNFALIIVTYVGQFYSPITGLIISFILGYYQDIVTGTLMGLNSFSTVSICYLSYLLGKRIVMQRVFAQVLTVFVFSIIYSIIVYSLIRFFSIDLSGLAYIIKATGEGVATAIISPFIIGAIKRMERLLKFKNERNEDAKDIRI